MAFLGEFYHTLKKLTPIILELFQKTEEVGTLSNSFYKSSITLISESKTLLEKYMNFDAKILNKILAN